MDTASIITDTAMVMDTAMDTATVKDMERRTKDTIRMTTIIKVKKDIIVAANRYGIV